jgi:hypothetical protein
MRKSNISLTDVMSGIEEKRQSSAFKKKAEEHKK